MESPLIRVLLVDDDPEEGTLTRRMLSSAGNGEYSLDWLGKYDEAVEVIGRGGHDAYLIDYRLQQGHDGLDLLREAKRRGCRAPLILLTGMADAAIDEQALKEGAADYLVKGQFSPALLERSLRYSIERKRTEESLRQKDEHLRMVQKLDAIGRLAGGIAHEFNNILAGIICYADMIQKASAEPDGRRADAGEIMALGERAAVLVRQLVTFSQPRTSRKLTLSLNDLVSRGAKMITSVCGERIQVKTAPAADLPSAHANPEHLDQVLINLCLNARDAIKGDGRITIETRRVELKEPLMTRRGALAPGIYACLSVTDSGEGIAEQNQAQIFDPFFTTKPQGKGTGLGLAVACGIMKEHGGAIDFESAPDRGTTLTIYLPAVTSAESPAAPASPAAAAAAGPGKGELILIADDEAVMRNILKRVLEANGYTPLLAEDGLQAVELFKANQDRVALVLLDVMMPNLDGAKACERIAALKPGVKVLFMSGYAAAEAHELLRGRQSDLIAKPFVPGEILQKIGEALGRRA